MAALCALALGAGCGGNAMPVVPAVDGAVMGDAGAAPGQCRAGATPASSAMVTFRTRNGGTAPVYLRAGCVGTEYAVTSCASGYTDDLGPKYACTCSCKDASCKAPPACGPCPAPAGASVIPGSTKDVAWSAEKLTFQPRGTFECLDRANLPAGRYRAGFVVFASEMAARTRSLAQAWSVAVDFELPVPGGVVDVDLAQPAATPACQPFAQDASPACAPPYARESACELRGKYAIRHDGGNALYRDEWTLSGPDVFVKTRTWAMQGKPPATCRTTVPRCWGAPGDVVTTADLARALAAPDVVAAFARPGMLVYGSDARPADGTVLVVDRGDGAFAIGGPCDATAGGFRCDRPVPAGMVALASLIGRLEQQHSADPACAALSP